MNPETKICKNCKTEFRIEPEDFAFYERISVPSPTWCPQCRRQRRLAWRNDFYFYPRACDLCKKPIISLYAPGKPLTVYCNACWWSDQWDAKGYGREFDFSRPFFDQFRELQNRVPRLALINDDGIASVNCAYTQDFAFGKNCYMTFVSWKVENCLYSLYLVNAKDTVDVSGISDDIQLVYDAIHVSNCYQCRNIYYSYSLRNSAFCYDCRDSSNCFLSIGLRHKQYCIKNKQYSKEEYERILADYRLDTWSGMERARKEFQAFILGYPRRYANNRQCVGVRGDDMRNCKNIAWGFGMRNAEDCAYVETCDSPKDSYDLSAAGQSNQCYEGITPDQSYRGLFTIFSWKNTDVAYCENCHSSKYLFGCAGMKKGEYCILNKQYSKEEFYAMRERIITHMQKTSEWGEFFPARLSHFGYNETLAQQYYPLIREEALGKKYQWQDTLPMTRGKETILPEQLPDSISDVHDSITQEILACVSCGRNYRIIPQELSLYRAMKVPIPRQCFYCRLDRRFRFRNPYFLWQRSCTCGGSTSDNGAYANQAEHLHGASHCPNQFETSYAPNRPEIVYCEQCYQAEVG